MDVTKFLFSRDARGRTQVHRPGCQFLGLHGSHDCGCVKRLAAGTLDSMIGKLQAFFNGIGRVGPYSALEGSGNPCLSPEVKLWLKSSVNEQRRARITPHQAAPFFSEHLRFLVKDIRSRLASASSRSFLPHRFVLLRDLAFFTCQWFAGDRAGDLGNSIGREVSRLENGNLLMNHVIGKTVRVMGTWLLSLSSWRSPIFARLGLSTNTCLHALLMVSTSSPHFCFVLLSLAHVSPSYPLLSPRLMRPVGSAYT